MLSMRIEMLTLYIPNLFYPFCCNLEVNDCDGVECQNGGTCHDEYLHFTCECDELHDGRYCENSKCNIIMVPGSVSEM